MFIYFNYSWFTMTPNGTRKQDPFTHYWFECHSCVSRKKPSRRFLRYSRGFPFTVVRLPSVKGNGNDTCPSRNLDVSKKCIVVSGLLALSPPLLVSVASPKTNYVV